VSKHSVALFSFCKLILLMIFVFLPKVFSRTTKFQTCFIFRNWSRYSCVYLSCQKLATKGHRLHKDKMGHTIIHLEPGKQEYKNVRMQECKNARMQECKNASKQACKNARMQKCKHSSIQAFKHSSIQAFKHSRMQECKNIQEQEYKNKNRKNQ